MSAAVTELGQRFNSLWERWVSVQLQSAVVCSPQCKWTAGESKVMIGGIVLLSILSKRNRCVFCQ